MGSVVLVLVLLASFPGLAAPLTEMSSSSISTIPYQGRLADAGGIPVTGKQNMEFRLYDVPIDGTPLWVEFWTGAHSVDVSDGLFSVMLGSLNTDLASVVQSHTTLFLGITVDIDKEMTPRVQLGTVPFSVWSLTVADNSVTSAKIADGAVGTSELVDASVTSAKIVDGAVGSSDIADSAVTAAKLADGAAGNWIMFEQQVTVVPLGGITATGTNPPWQTVDISQYVSPHATVALISIQSAADGAGVYVQVRPVGSQGGGGQLWTTQWVGQQ